MSQKDESHEAGEDFILKWNNDNQNELRDSILNCFIDSFDGNMPTEAKGHDDRKFMDGMFDALDRVLGLEEE